MNNKRYLPILVVTAIGVLALGTAQPAFGADIYNANGFENFVVGQPLVGQDPSAAAPFGWVGVSILSPGAAVVTRDLFFSPPKSVEVQGVNLVHEDHINDLTKGYYDAIGSYRRPVNYDVGANGFPIVRIQAEVRIDGPLSPPANNFFSASIAARGHLQSGSTAGIGELAISSDGYAYGYSGDDNVPTFQARAPITLGTWHNLAIDLDFSFRTYTFYVDGTPLPGGPFPFLSRVNTNTLARGSLIAYVAPDTTTLQKSHYVVHYDNFLIATR